MNPYHNRLLSLSLLFLFVSAFCFMASNTIKELSENASCTIDNVADTAVYPIINTNPTTLDNKLSTLNRVAVEENYFSPISNCNIITHSYPENGVGLFLKTP